MDGSLMALEFRDILNQFNDDWEADEHNRDEALEDLHFVRGGEHQWPERVLADRKAKGRPIITVNQMPQFVRQVSGDIRQSQPAIECYPVDDQIDPILSEIYEGLIRQIEYQSGAQSVYGFGAECAIMSGIGHWRIITDYADDSAFDQDIFIKRIMDPLAVVWDGGATEMDRSDAKHCFVQDMLLESEFKERYPKASLASMDDGVRGNTRSTWIDGDFVRIAEYWYKKEIEITLGLTQDGQTIRLDEIDPSFIPMLGIIRERKAKSHKVCRLLMSGSEILDDEQEWAGKHLPIVPVIGSEMSINGEVVRKSLIRDAKAPQQLYNFWRSHAAEAIALAPKSPWLVETENIKGFESFWNRANRDNLPYLPFKASQSNFVPQRQQPAAPPSAMWQEAAVARDDMKATTGIYDASLGQRSNETSGKAIEARQSEGDTGSYVFIDNFNAAIRRTGQVLVDLIPRIYDSERMVRVMTSDEQQQFVPINKVVMAPDGQEVVINDLSTGRFDVRIKTGPSYATSRKEAREHMAMVLQGNQQLLPIIGDLYFENMDFRGADKIAERMKKMLPPQLSDEPAQPDPMVEAQQRMQMAGAELDLAKKQAEIENEEADTAKKLAEIETEQVDAASKAFEMGMGAGLRGV
jgi:hypothetical protein